MMTHPCNHQGHVPGRMERPRGLCGCFAGAASTLRLVALTMAASGSVAAPTSASPRGFPPVSTNRCSDLDLSGLTNAMNCGSPLSSPCFDFNRCRDGPPTVYIYDQKCSLTDSNKIQSRGFDMIFRTSATEAGVLADTYDSACFFINVNTHEFQGNSYEPQCATTAPLWNEGRNHVMIDLWNESRDQRPSYSGSYAMEAASSQRTCYYRSGYDISIGLWPKAVFHELQSTLPNRRSYFLTFRGTLHLKFHGSEERESIRGLHDDSEGVIVAEKCRRDPSKASPEIAEKCAELLPRYDAYDYQLLMNSTFGLAPAGSSPGTHRLAEVMSAGCIPVIVARDFVKPFAEEFDWSAFSFTFSPDEVPDMIRTLRSVSPEELKQMQAKSLEAYWKIYGGAYNYSVISRHIIDVVVRRIGHRES